MERLTNKREADAQRKEYERRLANGYPRNIPEERFLRLAAYEDTHMMPSDVTSMRMDMAIIAALFDGVDVDRMKELAEADKEGRLVVLPCKTVFELTWDAGPECDLVCPVSIDGNGCCDFCDKGKLFAYERPCCQEHIERLGKTVFLTREEAEKALEAMDNG